MHRALILNVDDYQAARYAKTRLLINAAFRVVEAETGKEALDLVSSLYPRLVLLDVKLPDTDGRDVCRKIKAHPTSADVLVVLTSSALISPNDVTSSRECGADAYLAAPFQPRDLVALVRSVISRTD